MRRREHGPSRRILIVGDVADLDDIQSVLDRLPGDTYGQLYLQASRESDIGFIAAPRRLTVTWLTPALGYDHAPGVAARRLATMLRAWTQEWMPGDVAGTTATMWVGATAAAYLLAHGCSDQLGFLHSLSDHRISARALDRLGDGSLQN